MQTARMDIDDLYSTAWQGMHSGCAAGAFLCVLRGVLGVKYKEDALYINPSVVPFWKSVKMNFAYKGKRINVRYENGKMILTSKTSDKISIVFKGKRQTFAKKAVLQ